MKKLLFLFLSMGVLFAEPLYYGAYYGDIKEKMTKWNNYPAQAINSAGRLYLLNNNIEIYQYIIDKKSQHINDAVKDAKKYAKEEKFSKCGLDNIKHQIIMDDNQVIVMTDYNVIGFD